MGEETEKEKLEEESIEEEPEVENEKEEAEPEPEGQGEEEEPAEDEPEEEPEPEPEEEPEPGPEEKELEPKEEAADAWQAIDQARKAVAAGRPEVASAQLASALETFEALDDMEGQAETLFELGVLAVTQGEYDAALEKYDAAMKIYRKLKDEESIAEVTRQKGHIHFLRGEI